MQSRRREKRSSRVSPKDEGVLSIYLRELATLPLMEKGEADRCAELAAAGDEKARERLILANLRFVISVAKRYQNLGLALPDLISEGNIGLINAIEKFDSGRGCHFTSYAVWWIKRSIRKAVSDQSRMIRLPSNKDNTRTQIEKARMELCGLLGREPETSEIAGFMDRDRDEVESLLQVSGEVVSLDKPVSPEKNSPFLRELLADQQYKSPEEVVIQRSLKEETIESLKALPKREADIIRHRFGLNGQGTFQLQWLGDRFRLTKERVRQLEMQALRRLKNQTRSKFLAAYVN